MDKQRVGGWVVSAIPGLMIGSSGVNLMMKTSFVMEGLAKYAYPESAIVGMGLAAFLSADGLSGRGDGDPRAGGGALVLCGGVWGAGLGGAGDAGCEGAGGGRDLSQ